MAGNAVSRTQGDQIRPVRCAEQLFERFGVHRGGLRQEGEDAAAVIVDDDDGQIDTAAGQGDQGGGSRGGRRRRRSAAWSMPPTGRRRWRWRSGRRYHWPPRLARTLMLRRLGAYHSTSRTGIDEATTRAPPGFMVLTTWRATPISVTPVKRFARSGAIDHLGHDLLGRHVGVQPAPPAVGRSVVRRDVTDQAPGQTLLGHAEGGRGVPDRPTAPVRRPRSARRWCRSTTDSPPCWPADGRTAPRRRRGWPG